MISAFVMEQLAAAFIDITWRVAAIVMVAWALLRLWGNITPRYRRRAWIVAHLALLASVLIPAVQLVRRIRAGASASQVIELPAALPPISIMVPRRTVPASPIALAVLALGTLGAMAALSRRIAQTIRVRRLMRAAHPLADPVLLMAVDRASRAAGLRRAPSVRICRSIHTAAVHGIFRPVLLLGRSAPTWPAAQRDQIFCHELQHLAGRDIAVAWFADLVRLVLWWHPAVYFAGKALASAQELSCDARVIATGVSREAYAEMLLDMARSVSQQHFAAGLGMASAPLPLRIQTVLDNDLPTSRLPAVWLPLIEGVAIVAILCVPAAAQLRDAGRQQKVLQTLGAAKAAKQHVYLWYGANGDVMVRSTPPPIHR